MVKNITDYGAFVDLGGIDGLLHVTDISYKRVNHPSEVINIGDTVKVQIVRINRDTQRISLGMKQLESDPWEGAAAKYPVGGVFQGRVTNITEYGAFVELEAGIEGLVHVSEMSWTKKNVHPGKIVSTSQEVEVKVLEVDEEKRRISLGLKQAQSNPWEAFAENASGRLDRRGRGQELDRVRPVHRPRGRRRRHGPHVGHRLGRVGRGSAGASPQGREVKAQVLDVDVEKERISLGMKQLERGGVAGRAAAPRAGGAKKGEVVTVDVLEVQRRRARSPGRRRRRDRLHQAHRPRPRPRRAASGALPGRPEVRRDGHRLRPLEEAELLDQGAADLRREAGGCAVRLVGLGRVARRHPRRGAEGKAGAQGEGRGSRRRSKPKQG